MFQQTTKTQLFVICALRVTCNTYEVSVYTARTFMKCTHKKLINSLPNYKINLRRVQQCECSLTPVLKPGFIHFE